MSLSQVHHEEVKALELQFLNANDDSKNVAIRDRLDEIFTGADVLFEWRLLADEVGINDVNRDGEGITASGTLVRARKIMNSGFSLQAAGKLWAFEDHPKEAHR